MWVRLLLINGAVFPIDCGAGRNTLADCSLPIPLWRGYAVFWLVTRSVYGRIDPSAMCCEDVTEPISIRREGPR